MIAILIAKTKEGKHFKLIEKMDRQVLREIRQDLQFYCLQCNEPVLLKVGEVNIPHFSHQQDSACRSLFSEGESAGHLAGKQQLYTFFKQQQGITVQLEPYLADLSQRPDLLVSMQHEKIPIEFQCSRIATSDLVKRTTGYLTAQMTPIWILQTPDKLKQLPQGITIYSLSRFEENFLQSFHFKRNYVLTYDVHAQKFHYLSTLLHLAGRKFIVNHRTLSIAQQSFPFANPNLLTTEELEGYYSIYFAYRSKFLTQRIFYNRRGIKDPFLRKCYEVRLLPSELPEWIGVPITGAYLSAEHACEWQLSLLHFIFKKNKTIDQISVKELYEFAYRHGHVPQQVHHLYKAYLLFLLNIGVTSVTTQLPLSSEKKIKKLVLQHLQNEMKIEKI